MSEPLGLRVIIMQVQKKADISRLTKMSATINAIAHKTLEVLTLILTLTLTLTLTLNLTLMYPLKDQNPDSAGMFFRCLSCDTKLPKLKGNHAMKCLDGPCSNPNFNPNPIPKWFKGDHAMQCLDGLLPQQNAAPVHCY